MPARGWGGSSCRTCSGTCSSRSADTRSFGGQFLGRRPRSSSAAWGWFLYQGVVDPLGGINSLWPIFGVANQLLAVIAFALGTTVLIKMGRTRYLWVTLAPLAWLLSVTMTAGWMKIFSADPRLGFLSAARDFAAKIEAGGTAAQVKQWSQLLFNNQVNAVVTGAFLVLVATVVITCAPRLVAAPRRQARRGSCTRSRTWFEGLGKPLHVVLGNNEWHRLWPLSCGWNGRGARCFLVHIPPSRAPAGTDIVLHGHTHEPRDETDARGVRWLNPGCITRPNRQAPASFGWLTLAKGRAARLAAGVALSNDAVGKCGSELARDLLGRGREQARSHSQAPKGERNLDGHAGGLLFSDRMVICG
jgi:hypothetical protein